MGYFSLHEQMGFMRYLGTSFSTSKLYPQQPLRLFLTLPRIDISPSQLPESIQEIFAVYILESEYIYSVINPPANRARKDKMNITSSTIRRLHTESFSRFRSDSDSPSDPEETTFTRSFNPSGAVPHWNDLMVHRSDQYPR